MMSAFDQIDRPRGDRPCPISLSCSSNNGRLIGRWETLWKRILIDYPIGVAGGFSMRGIEKKEAAATRDSANAEQHREHAQ